MTRVVLVALLLLPWDAGAAAGRRLGLFVGSNGAPHGREPLRHAEADARRLRQVFVDVGEMAEADAKLLLGPDHDALLAALRDLTARAAEDPDALVLFYYSGHADDRALLLGPSELRLADLRATLESIRARLGVHIVDACRSGALTRAKGATRGARFSVVAEPRAEGRVVITSSAAWEDAQESDRLGGSFFTLHLTSALRGAADADDDGAVTLAEAYDYVYARTVSSTRATVAGPQHPTYRYDLRGRGDTVLTWVDRGDMGHLALGDGDYLVIDAGTGRVVAEVSARAKGETLALRGGVYRVSRRDDDALWEGDVPLASGATARADAHLTRRVPYAALVRKGGSGVASSVWVEGGVRGPLGEGIGSAPLLRLAYALELPWFTLRPHVGASTNLPASAQETPRLELDLTELQAGLEIRRAFDARWVTLSVGVLGDALWLRQSDRDGNEADRDAVGFAFGAVAALERDFAGLLLMVSAELDAYTFPSTDDDRAPATDGALRTVLTFRTTLGVGHAF